MMYSTSGGTLSSLSISTIRGISRADLHLANPSQVKYGFVDPQESSWISASQTSKNNLADTGVRSTIEVMTGGGTLDNVDTSLLATSDDEDDDFSDSKTVDYSESGCDETRRNEHFVETDRTSVSSSDDWTDCEFDKQASRRVRLLFTQIDTMLYSGGVVTQSPSFSGGGIDCLDSLPPAHSESECSEWRSVFPHLRLVGSQLCPSKDTGYSHQPVPSEVTPRPVSAAVSITLDDVSTTESHQEGLTICGRQMAILEPDDSVVPFCEEIILTEGIVDEPIATDDRLDQVDTTSRTSAQRHRSSGSYSEHHPGAARGLPPLTPSLAVRDTVQSLVFDCLWQRVSEWMRPLYMEYLRHSTSSNISDHDVPDSLAADNLISDSFPKFSSPQTGGFSLSVTRSRLAGLASTAAVHSSNDLTGLLKISTKALNYRGDSTQRPTGVQSPLQLHDIPESPNQMVRPKSGQGRVQSARRSRAPRLAPLDSRSKTPADAESESSDLHSHSAAGGFSLRGRGIQPSASQQLYSSLMRSGTLPPLSESRRVVVGSNGRVGSGRPVGMFTSVLDRPSTSNTQRNKYGMNSATVQSRGLDVHGKALSRGHSSQLEMEESTVTSPANEPYNKVAQWGAFPTSTVLYRKNRPLTNALR